VPPAFVLSQDQTLHRDLDHTRGWGHDHEESPDRPLADRQLELLEKTSLSAPRRARRGTPALAFGINCSVFKEPRPDGRPTEVDEDRRADTHSAAARSGAASSVRVKCSSRRESPPASGPIRLWVEVFTVKRLSPPQSSHSARFPLRSGATPTVTPPPPLNLPVRGREFGPRPGVRDAGGGRRSLRA
jgi:hypothetical protein